MHLKYCITVHSLLVSILAVAKKMFRFEKNTKIRTDSGSITIAKIDSVMKIYNINIFFKILSWKKLKKFQVQKF
jgi:hypothetical protein